MAKTSSLAPSGSIYVLAGCNGAGKSSIGGAALRDSGVEFFNPDEAEVNSALKTVKEFLPVENLL